MKWITSFLAKRTQRVVCEGKQSYESDMTSGVPQGTVLGPLLFLAYINDLPECLSPGTTARLYADDSLVYRRITSEEDAKILQEDINRLQEWEARWLMEFNPDKCEVLRITLKQAPIISEYFIHDHQLQTVESAKYLGLHIDSKLNFNTHVDKTVKKANGVRAMVQRNTQFCPRTTKAEAYKTLVRPVVEYASSIWSPHTTKNKEKVESVQRKGARYVMSDWQQKSSVTEMLRILEWHTLEQRRQQARLLMLFKIINGLVDIDPAQYLTPAIVRGQEAKRFIIPHTRVSAYQYSFFPAATRLWFNLAPDMTLLPTVAAFRSQLASIQF